MQFCISAKARTKAAISDSQRKKCYETVSWKGKVYCVSVPNQTLLVRRNGKTVFSGNCLRYVMMWGGGPVYLHSKDRAERRSEYVAANAVTGY